MNYVPKSENYTWRENTITLKEKNKKLFLFFSGSQTNVARRYDVNKKLAYNGFKPALETVYEWSQERLEIATTSR